MKIKEYVIKKYFFNTWFFWTQIHKVHVIYIILHNQYTDLHLTLIHNEY